MDQSVPVASLCSSCTPDRPYSLNLHLSALKLDFRRVGPSSKSCVSGATPNVPKANVPAYQLRPASRTYSVQRPLFAGQLLGGFLHLRF